VIIQVLIAQSDSIDPLRQELLECVLSPTSIAVISETPGELVEYSSATVHFTEQQHPRIRAQIPAIEPSYNLTATGCLKPEEIGITLCRHNGFPGNGK
jgi:hypothetical protein